MRGRFNVLRAAVGIGGLALVMGCWPGETIASQLSLSWVDNASDELGYSVERSTQSAGPFGEIARTGPRVTSYADSSVVAETTYCYRVRAYNAGGYSAYTNVACGRATRDVGLAVVKMGSGGGTVTSTPAGISCGPACSATYPSGSAITLTSTPATGSAFEGWSDDVCRQAGGACRFTLTAPTTVTPTFALVVTSGEVALRVAKVGGGNGTVTSAPPGIACGSTCSATYAVGTSIVLRAVPAAGSAFAGWRGGGCTGRRACRLTLTSSTTVEPVFVARKARGEISRRGPRPGRVTRWPATRDCGEPCAAPPSTPVP